MSDIFKNIEIPYAAQKPATQKPVNVPEMKFVSEPVAPAAPVNKDTVELSSDKTQQKTKKGPIKAVKGFISNIRKFFSTAGAYVKGTAKGIATGAVAGSLVYTSGAIINSARNHAAKKSQKVIKNIPNKALAGVVAVAALGLNLWNASLNATQRQSEIDMRYKGLNK